MGQGYCFCAGLVELGDRLFWGHEAFDRDLTNVVGVFWGAVGANFEHENGVFDLVEPEALSFVVDGEVGTVDVGRSTP